MLGLDFSVGCHGHDAQCTGRDCCKGKGWPLQLPGRPLGFRIVQTVCWAGVVDIIVTTLPGWGWGGALSREAVMTE